MLMSMAILVATLALPIHPPQERQKEFVRCFREEFDPTDAQLDTLEKEVFANNADIRATAEALKVQTEEMEARLETADAPDSELLERFQRIAALRAKLSEDHFRRMLALRAVLTPEQRKKFLVCKRRLGPPAPPHE